MKREGRIAIMEVSTIVQVASKKFILCIYLWIIHDLGLRRDVMTADAKGSQDTVAYKYLDNDLYHVPVITKIPSISRTAAEEEFERVFPRPPLFPPPPPSMNDDVNALLRKAIFNHLDMDKSKGDPGQDPGNSSKKNSNLKGSKPWNPCSLLHNDKPSNPNKGEHHNSKGNNPHGDKIESGDSSHNDSEVLQCGLPGPQGDKGDRGRRGKKGKQGPHGPPGPTGRPGSVGPVGPKGTRGYPGKSGKDGKPGPVGPKGSRGVPGRPGLPGPAGSEGADGIPGLVIFPDAATMYGVALEGLIAYRSDVKILYFRDNVTWRPIRITRCGDGILDRDMDEECDDGNNNDHDDCVGCRRARCGDGVRHRGSEECDGRDFGSKSCSSWRPGLVGPLQCTKSCKIIYHRCRMPRR